VKGKIGLKNILILFIAFTLLAHVLSILLVYNKLVDELHFLHIAHGRLETEQQRRYDIVTRTEAVVGEYVELERKIFSRLVTLNGFIEAAAPESTLREKRLEIATLMHKLTLLVEDYPDLKAKGPYIFLMDTIQETGKRVTEERLNYNNRAYEYNMMRQIFPYHIVALVSGFSKEPFFEADRGAETVPEVRGLYNDNIHKQGIQ